MECPLKSIKIHGRNIARTCSNLLGTILPRSLKPQKNIHKSMKVTNPDQMATKSTEGQSFQGTEHKKQQMFRAIPCNPMQSRAISSHATCATHTYTHKGGKISVPLRHLARNPPDSKKKAVVLHKRTRGPKNDSRPSPQDSAFSAPGRETGKQHVIIHFNSTIDEIEWRILIKKATNAETGYRMARS